MNAALSGSVLAVLIVALIVTALLVIRQGARASRECVTCHGRGFTRRWDYQQMQAVCDPCPACPAGQAFERSLSDDPAWPV